MSSSDLDVSWAELRRIVRGWAGSSAEIAELRHLHGGSVSNTLGLTLEDGAKVVMKITPHRVDRTLRREAQQLNHLRMLGVPVPTVYGWALTGIESGEQSSWLLMEWCEGVDLGTARESSTPEEWDALQRELADVVLMMHAQTNPAYMRIGLGGPDDEESPSWPEFFARVYAPMWAELEKDPATTKSAKKDFDRIHKALPQFLAHGDVPRLVHWDLWSANVLAKRDEAGVWKVSAILDPMCKYAHAEAELAYLEVFHTVNGAFMRHYRGKAGLSEGYAMRKKVYELYFLMDHAAFFGGSYHRKFADAASKIAAMC